MQRGHIWAAITKPRPPCTYNEMYWNMDNFKIESLCPNIPSRVWSNPHSNTPTTIITENVTFVKPVQDYITVVNVKQDLNQKPVNFFQDETNASSPGWNCVSGFKPCMGERWFEAGPFHIRFSELRTWSIACDKRSGWGGHANSSNRLSGIQKKFALA